MRKYFDKRFAFVFALSFMVLLCYGATYSYLRVDETGVCGQTVNFQSQVSIYSAEVATKAYVMDNAGGEGKQDLAIPSAAGNIAKLNIAGQVYDGGELPVYNNVEFGIACSDESTALTAGTSKVTFRMPYAMTVTEVRASLNTAQATGDIFTVDINESGSSILSTKLTLDNTEKTSVTATTAPVISDTSLADDAEITIDVDQIGDSTATGLKVLLKGTR